MDRAEKCLWLLLGGASVMLMVAHRIRVWDDEEETCRSL